MTAEAGQVLQDLDTSNGPPPAAIRKYNADTDLKVVRYLIGASIMEPSAVANSSLLLSPFGLAVWFALSAFAIQRFTKGIPRWPGTDKTELFLQFLVDCVSLFPTLVAPPLVIVALAEFRHRNLFERKMRTAIGEEDLRDIPGYYQSSDKSRSGFWVLEFDGRLIGLVSLDAKKPGEALASVETVAEETKEKSGKETASKIDVATAEQRVAPSEGADGKTIHIRRLAASLGFKAAGVEDDLIEFACDHAFDTSASRAAPAERLIIAVRPALERQLVSRLQKVGFVRSQGISIQESAKPSVLDAVWPVRLASQTYVLEAKKWQERRKQQ